MSEVTHCTTKPQDRISLSQKLIYGLGGLVNNLLGAAVGCMAIVLNLGLGMNPALVGTLMALPRLTDALTDPIMGYISDNTRSRFGRRKPYIFFGAIFSGIIFAMMWQLRPGQSETFYFWYFLIVSIIFYLAYTVYATPWVALGYEMTPDYHERTRVMGFSNWIGQFAWVIAPWFWKIMENDTWFANSVEGARGLAIIVGTFVAIVGIMPAIFCKERFGSKADTNRKAVVKIDGLGKNIAKFFKGFAITLKSKPFLKLCTSTFLVFNGFMLVSAFSSYVIIYYVFGGDSPAGATYMGLFGTVSSISTFCVIPFITWVSTKIGKRRAFIFSTTVSIFGYAMKWFCYNPAHPNMLLIPAPFIAFGLGGLFTLMGAMMADVCDVDEVETGERREGMYGSIYWWMVKLGMALAFAISGHLLNATGFKVELGGEQTVRTLLLLRVFDISVPMITSLIAVITICTFKVTEEKALEVRKILEARRGCA
ncbi:MAG: MFS transporter [Candidatus Omnitrophica bacterium]|nr:MFS transporter [Candidatus Omnitrophota bacterium]